MAKDLAIVLSSGSVNSAVTTSLAAQRFRPILLHVEVESESATKLNAAYEQQLAHFKPYRHHTLTMPFLSVLKESIQPQPVADPRQRDPLAPQLTALLPMIAIAARFAAHYQAQSIFCGLRVGGSGGNNAAVDDLATATEYVQIWEEMLQVPCAQPELRLEMPLLEMEAWQVVDVGFQVATPMEKTWSCQENMPEPCWSCRECRSREAAFQQAAKPDPLHLVRKV